MTTIDAGTLRRWLDEGRPVIVLDVRRADDRAEWAIPGSIHVDSYQAIKSGDPAALSEVDLPVDMPVVTVCGQGAYEPDRRWRHPIHPDRLRGGRWEGVREGRQGGLEVEIGRTA
jgi:hypothetical protein